MGRRDANSPPSQSPERQTVKKLFHSNKSDFIIACKLHSYLIKQPLKMTTGIISKKAVA